MNIRIGSLFINEYKGKKLYSIGLGNKSKDPKYNLSVELVVKDGTGKVVARQSDVYINLVDPRTQPDELLAAGIIDEERAEKMREGLKSLPEKIKFNLNLKV